MVYLPKAYKIIKIDSINDEVKLFRIKGKLNPKPGQFLEVSLPGIGECPLASCSYNNEQLDLLVKKAGNTTAGMFQLKKDDLIYIRGPYGKGFPIEELKNKNLLLFAGGTGIAPITSLINYIEENNNLFKKIIIYFGFKDANCILLNDKIKKWKKQFQVTVCLEKKGLHFGYEEGYIQDIIKEHNLPIKNTIACLCGPEMMMKNITKALNKLNIKNKDIYWSLERRMECGFGNCNRCLIQDVYVCRNGPVFNYSFIKPKLDREEKANEE
jgi:anaerobic sulfite reductase subunit B